MLTDFVHYQKRCNVKLVLEDARNWMCLMRLLGCEMRNSEPLQLAHFWVTEQAFESNRPLVIPTKDHDLAGLLALPA